jgi:MFS transporter, DHA1 family, multidrug resistance protein
MAAQSLPESAAVTPSTPPARGGLIILILAALTGMTPLATDMYLPAFPAMSQSLHVSSSTIQLTLTAYMLGMVVGQMLIGPISDATGRRRLLLAGGLLYAVFSLLCAVAPNAPTLDVARLLEGGTGAAGMVLARAVVSDWYQGVQAAKRFSILSMIFAAAPVFAPVIGSLVLRVASWRSIFVVLAVIGVLLLGAVARWVPESLPVERRHSGGVPAAFRAMGSLVRQRAFLGYVLTFSLASAAMFAYISGSSFVFQNVYGKSETVYSLIFASNALGLLIAGAVFGALSHRVRLNTMLTVGVLLGLAAASAQIAVSSTGHSVLATTWLFTFLTMVAMGLTIPSVMTIGQEVGHRAGGAASAALGAGQCLFGGIASPIVGLLGTSSDRPMATVMIIGFGCATLALLALSRPWQGYGEPTPHQAVQALATADATHPLPYDPTRQ